MVSSESSIKESLVTSVVIGSRSLFAFVFRSFNALLETLRSYACNESYFIILMVGFLDCYVFQMLKNNTIEEEISTYKEELRLNYMKL